MVDFPAQTGEPEHTGLLIFQLLAGLLIHIHMLHSNVLATTQGKVNHARAHGVVGEPVG